jgi:hypothetical protein
MGPMSSMSTWTAYLVQSAMKALTNKVTTRFAGTNMVDVGWTWCTWPERSRIGVMSHDNFLPSTTTMAGNNGQPSSLQSCGLSLPTPRSQYGLDLEDSPELPESVLPFWSNAYMTPAPLLQHTEHRRQHQFTQNNHQNTFDSWNLRLGMPQVRI